VVTGARKDVVLVVVVVAVVSSLSLYWVFVVVAGT
jgi:hypothetical protein